VNDINEILITVLRRYAWMADQNQEFPMDSSFTDLGIDSMTIIQVTMELESELDLVIPDTLFTIENFQSPMTLKFALQNLSECKTL
jgi:acyl carrier protein